MTRKYFESVVLHNVVECRIVKRDGTSRTILCTRSALLLDTPEGRYYLHWKRPKKRPHWSPKQHGNSIVWDIQKEDWRQIHCANITILRRVPDYIYLEAVREAPKQDIDFS